MISSPTSLFFPLLSPQGHPRPPRPKSKFPARASIPALLLAVVGLGSGIDAAIVQQAYVKSSNSDADDRFGTSVAISGDTMVIGAPREASNATGIGGNQANNSAPWSGAAYVYVRSGGVWTQQAYLKASNAEQNDLFGSSVAISGDTIVVGAPRESSNATGVNGDQADNSAGLSGAAYVFVRNGATWSQQAYLKASNTDASDNFGIAVAIDGDTVAVGADQEQSNATGIDGNQEDDSLYYAGAVYVFVRDGATWSQQAYLKASNTNQFDSFGGAVAVAGDTVAVGALGENSSATGIDGDETDNSAAAAGAAYVFVRSGTAWSQQAYVKASNTDSGDSFGISVALAGETLVVGADEEGSAATGVDGDQDDDSASGAGAAYVFVRDGTSWSQQAYLKASNAEAEDFFGYKVAVSGDIVLVGSSIEDSAATGIDGNQADNSAEFAGAAYCFRRSGTTWLPHAYLKASNTGAGDGFSVGIGIDGDTAVIAATGESSDADGPGGNQDDDSAASAGAAYVFTGFGGAATTAPEIAVEHPAGTGLADGISEVDFGNGPVGQAGEPKSFIVRNLGDAELTGLGVLIEGPAAADFELDASGFGSSLAPGASSSFTVTHTPSAPGTRLAFLRISSNDANENPFDITLAGGRAPEIAVEEPAGTNLIDGSATSDLGSTLTGTSSEPKTFTVRNLGDADLGGLSVTLDGANAGDFSIDTSGLADSLGPGASGTFTVTFTPFTKGLRVAALHIASNDGDENPFDISLTGTGQTPQAPGHEIHTVAESFDYHFPNGTHAYLRHLEAPLIDGGQAFFNAMTGIFGTSVQFLYNRGGLINLMDTMDAIPGTDPTVYPDIMRAESFHNGFCLGAASNYFKNIDGFYRLHPGGEIETIVDNLPAEPGGVPEFESLGTSILVGDTVVFDSWETPTTFGLYKTTGGGFARFLESSGQTLEGQVLRRVEMPFVADDTHMISEATLDSNGERWLVTLDLDGNLEALARPGDPIPGLGKVIEGVGVQKAGISGVNHVFNAFWKTGDTIGTVLMGSMDDHPESTEVFVKSGDPVPGSPGLTFADFGTIAQHGNSFVFFASFQVPGPSWKSGLFLWKDGAIQPLYDTRQPLAGKQVPGLFMDPQGYDGDYVGFRCSFNGSVDGVFMMRTAPWPANIADWKQRFFSPAELADPAVSGNDADPDFDGLVNTIEFVTGLDPRKRDRIEPPRIEDGYAVFEFPVAYGVEDFTVHAEFSSDALGWSPESLDDLGTVEMLKNKRVRVRTARPVAELRTGFFRLVARPAP